MHGLYTRYHRWAGVTGGLVPPVAILSCQWPISSRSWTVKLERLYVINETVISTLAPNKQLVPGSKLLRTCRVHARAQTQSCLTETARGKKTPVIMTAKVWQHTPQLALDPNSNARTKNKKKQKKSTKQKRGGKPKNYCRCIGVVAFGDNHCWTWATRFPFEKHERDSSLRELFGRVLPQSRQRHAGSKHARRDGKGVQ